MKKQYLLYIATAVAMAAVSCTKFPDNINVDPNLASQASNAQLLTYAINRMTAVIESPAGILYTQQWAEKPYTDESRYTVVNYDFYTIYSGALKNLQTIIDSKKFDITLGSPANQVAVARVLRAWFFWHITDRWGAVPYKEALKGLTNFTPVYDSQKDIYYDMMKELKEAAAQFDNGNEVQGDILYGGKVSRWRSLANSMRMLMALRLSKIDPDKGKAEFADAMAAGYMGGNQESAVYVHLANEVNQDYWYYVSNVQGRKWYWASATIVDYLKLVNDPRLKIFADEAEQGGYKGVPYGLDGNAVGSIPSASVSLTGVHVRTQNAPTYIITYPQVLLAVAEAAKLGWIAGGDLVAEENYKKAVEHSFRQWIRNSFKTYDDDRDNQIEKVPYDATDLGDTTGYAAYMEQPEVKYSGADALKKIGYQRWLHLYTHGYEAWAEWRRTGYPELTPAPDNGGTPIPRRQAYPVKEQNINSDHYKRAIQAQPGFNMTDDLKGRIWWDKP